jgi:hypothetical protein
VIRPNLGGVAEELYLALAPFTERINPDDPGRTITDEDLDWPLLIFFGTLAKRWQQVDDLSRDSDDGPGWSVILDVDRIPDEGLPYLAQFKGKTLLQGMTPQIARERINGTDGFDRGSPEAIRVATKRHLTGTRTVNIVERHAGDVFQYEVIVKEEECPSSGQTLRDAMEQKPYGFLMTFTVLPFLPDYNFIATLGTYNDLLLDYYDYNDMLSRRAHGHLASYAVISGRYARYTDVVAADASYDILRKEHV